MNSGIRNVRYEKARFGVMINVMPFERMCPQMCPQIFNEITLVDGVIMSSLIIFDAGYLIFHKRFSNPFADMY